MADRRLVVFRADELARICEGQLLSGSPDQEINSFTIDSRRIEHRDLFLAIRGNRYDGHDFVYEAIRKEVAGVIVSDRAVVPVNAYTRQGLAVIVVSDTTEALQAIARQVRLRSDTQVVAITGSVGKTTTKELAAAFVGTRHRVTKNAGNMNNHIGLPLSLLNLREAPDVAVVELGMNHAGEIRRLVGIAAPNVRVWTNVTQAHTEFFSSIDAIADAKAEILEGADTDDHLVVNAGDPLVMARISSFPGTVTTFGVDTRADVSATVLNDKGLDGISASIETREGKARLHSPLIGIGNVANVLAAICVALRFHVPLDAMLRIVETFEPPPRRGTVHRLSNGVTVVDASYNSNPEALQRALQSIGRTRGHRRRVAVLGEMLELGTNAQAIHLAYGRLAVESGFGCVVGVGGVNILALADGARAAGLADDVVMTCNTSEEAADVVATVVKARDLVMVKGSRGIRTEVVVDRLKAEWG